MNVYLEQLYHYNCDSCQRWWSVSDISPQIGRQVHCVHCSQLNTVEKIRVKPESLSLEEISKRSDKLFAIASADKIDTKKVLAYLHKEVESAQYEYIESEQIFYGEAPSATGVWTRAKSLEACRDELLEVLEDWLIVGIAKGHELPGF